MILVIFNSNVIELFNNYLVKCVSLLCGVYIQYNSLSIRQRGLGRIEPHTQATVQNLV